MRKRNYEKYCRRPCQVLFEGRDVSHLAMDADIQEGWVDLLDIRDEPPPGIPEWTKTSYGKEIHNWQPLNIIRSQGNLKGFLIFKKRGEGIQTRREYGDVLIRPFPKLEREEREKRMFARLAEA